ncbi:hypothetical protein SAMN04489752_1491 [Brevibacterium siliguriense]|uniref:HTH cro/C1-type domain-containing protein n=1 Tax=Brevibacterium siliguriense TaxID=1136497 RepID=A0A1H1RDI0_9MICO|nr:hypothetical protein [Brevibacterium siliguriense]SDS33762.1 hypothetical protein SAMN04489752_1491 [Brevibacterium siliguriense]
MDESVREQVAKFMGNIRACMKDHGVTVPELATLCGVPQHDLRLQLMSGHLDLNVCAALLHRTGQDQRAFGVDADFVPTGELHVV